MRAIAILTLVLSSQSLWAQPEPWEIDTAGVDGGGDSPAPVGGEFQINSYTTASQRYPAVAVAADGDFVVVWQSYGSSGSDDDSFSIQGQRFASDGRRVGSQFQVNSYTTNDQDRPAVAIAADGGFVVVWRSRGSIGSQIGESSVQGQRFASDGTALAAEFQVNTDTLSGQESPAVAMAADGDFVVVWRSCCVPGAVIQGKRFASDGTAMGGAFQVNSFSADEQGYPAVEVAPSGDFVVVWASLGSSGSDLSAFSVQGQRFTSDGTVAGDQFQVNTYTPFLQSSPDVAVAKNGNFVVVWNSYGSSGSDTQDFSIQGQRFASDGTAAGSEFQVNTYTTEFQYDPAVAAASHGDFVVVWQSRGSSGDDTSSISVQGQRFASDGTALGGQFQVNTYTTYGQRDAAVSAAPVGDFVVVWTSPGSNGSDTSYTSVQGQRYRSRCTTSTRLCLKSDRFTVEVDWRDFNGNTGEGKVVAASDDSGVFYFFAPDNWEMLVKVLDGCAITNHFWVFAAATTNVGYTLRVTDIETGSSKEYTNPLGTAAAAITDTAALPVCQ